MAPKKQMVAHNSAPSKDRTNTAVESMVRPHAVNYEHAAEDTGSSSSQKAAINAQSPPLYKDQILQMLADRKKQVKKQQAMSVRNRKQATSTTRMPPASRKR